MNIYLKYLLKGLFLSVIVYIIYLLAFNEENIVRIKSIINQLNGRSYSVLFIVFLFQFVNWGTEAIKFKYILSKKEEITYKQAILAVYTGNATGLFTPDRLGNFIGRFIHLNHINKRTVTAATMLGNLAQLVTTILFATLALLLYLIVDVHIEIPILNPIMLFSFIIIVLCLLLFVFYKPSFIIYYLQKIKGVAKHKNTFFFLNELNKIESTLVLAFSIFRYSIFIIQFYLLITTFGMTLDITETIVFTGLLYLFTTLIPSPILGNLGTREVVALLLLSNFNQPEIALVASLIIWLINVIFPSLVGSILLMKMNPSNKKV